MPAFERLILVRPGPCTSEAEGALPGLLNTELSVEGRAIADNVRHAVVKQPVPVHEVLSSPLVRAADTARTIAREALGQPSVRMVWELSDQNLGAWSGQPATSVPSQTGLDEVPPQMSPHDPRWAAMRYALQQRPYRQRAEPESLRDVLTRVRGFWLHHLYPRLGAGAVVIVSHDAALRALRVIVEGLDDDRMLDESLGHGDVVAYDVGGPGRPRITRLRSGAPEGASAPDL